MRTPSSTRAGSGLPRPVEAVMASDANRGSSRPVRVTLKSGEDAYLTRSKNSTALYNADGNLVAVTPRQYGDAYPTVEQLWK
jgi:hypothetical protein